VRLLGFLWVHLGWQPLAARRSEAHSPFGSCKGRSSGFCVVGQAVVLLRLVSVGLSLLAM
jgi:hypothetical protein